VYLREYFDIKEELLKCFKLLPQDYRPSLKSLLAVLGLRILGQHHRGLDDCKTITQIVQRLLNFGHGFDEPREVPSDPNYNPYEDPFFVDFGSTTEPTSWKCATPDCGIWNRFAICRRGSPVENFLLNAHPFPFNRPWMHYCRFCDCGQTNVTIASWSEAAM